MMKHEERDGGGEEEEELRKQKGMFIQGNGVTVDAVEIRHPENGVSRMDQNGLDEVGICQLYCSVG